MDVYIITALRNHKVLQSNHCQIFMKRLQLLHVKGTHTHTQSLADGNKKKITCSTEKNLYKFVFLK